ncbi:hypothetical protein PR048_017502 [Dryococelus australis]|uniref:Uncharacterized protein n=1 Tax=Dryococelus australis TaxID=614101 RepID=A0ABQ9H9R8_9NEOP|nr:hypothetical protein PR048_017502 [Dryococelus australis]
MQTGRDMANRHCRFLGLYHHVYLPSSQTDFDMWEMWQTFPLTGGFSRGTTVSPTLHSLLPHLTDKPVTYTNLLTVPPTCSITYETWNMQLELHKEEAPSCVNHRRLGECTGVDLATHVSKLENLVFRLKVLGNDIPENTMDLGLRINVPHDLRQQFAGKHKSCQDGHRSYKKSVSMNAERVGRVVTDYCDLKEVLYSCRTEEKGRKGANGLYVVTTTRDSILEALVAECKNLEITGTEDSVTSVKIV